MITFAQPIWILIGIAGCLLIWLLWHYFEHGRRQRLARFAEPPLLEKLAASVSPGRRTIKKLLLLGAVFLCFIALARPQYGHRWVTIKQKGIDILFALDTSKSMLAEDIRPNRLERSRLAILDFVSKLSGDRVGLLPFAGTSYLMCPLTSDYSAFEQTLMAVDQSTIPTGGTDIASTLRSTLEILNNDANHKILILISDGEHLRGDILEAAQRAAREKLRVYTIGVGSEAGELIPDRDNGGFVQDEDGRYIRSRLDRQNLQMIAETTGGLYVPLGEQSEGLETVYREKLALIPKTEGGEQRRQAPIERFGWPLLLAIMLLALEFMMSRRRADQSIWERLPRWRRSRRETAVLLLGVIFTTTAPANLHASRAEDDYARGDYLASAQRYQELLEKDPHNPRLNFNHGAAAYRNNLYEDAAESFARSLTTDDVGLQEKSYYNRANALYRLGESSLQAEPDRTVAAWQEAVQSYQSALSLNPENEQARENHRFVSEKLEQLKKEQQQQEQSDQQPEEQQDSGGQDKNMQQEQQREDTEKSQKQNSGKQPEPKAEQSPAQDDNAGSKDDGAAPGRAETDTAAENPLAAKTQQQAADRTDEAAPAEPGSAAMSRTEAEQLLRALQDEEGRIDLYAPHVENDTSSGKDW